MAKDTNTKVQKLEELDLDNEHKYSQEEITNFKIKKAMIQAELEQREAEIAKKQAEEAELIEVTAILDGIYANYRPIAGLPMHTGLYMVRYRVLKGKEYDVPEGYQNKK